MSIVDITLQSRWHEIFGETTNKYTELERKERWEQWKALVPKKDKDMIKYWESQEGCEGCRHLDTKTSWCNYAGLLCSINPILTMKHGMIGMACMGLGKELLQPVLFDNENMGDLPF